MAKLEAKLKLPPNAGTPASTEPAAPVDKEASAPLDNVVLKASPEMAENLAPVIEKVKEAADEGALSNAASDADREALLEAVKAARGETAPAFPSSYAIGVSLAERIYIISAPGGPRRRANLAFGPEPRELVWEDLGDTDEARELALDVLRSDPLIKIDGRYEERPVED